MAGWAARTKTPAPYATRCSASLIALKALTHAPTGGDRRRADDVAARGARRRPQLGLPLLLAARRDAHAARAARTPATATRRARGATGCCAPSPAIPGDLQIMYGVAGERRLPEFELTWLPGYEGSRAGAHRQRRASTSSSSTSTARCIDALLPRPRARPRRRSSRAGPLQTRAARVPRDGWQRPDDGIWEVRGPRRHFTHSKVMAWVAFDRAVRSVEEFEPDGTGRALAARFATRSTTTCCASGFDAERGTFTQSYGAKGSDAACCMHPAGRLPRRPTTRGCSARSPRSSAS